MNSNQCEFAKVKPFNINIFLNKRLLYINLQSLISTSFYSLGQFVKVYFVKTVEVRIRQSFHSPKFLVLR